MVFLFDQTLSRRRVALARLLYIWDPVSSRPNAAKFKGQTSRDAALGPRVSQARRALSAPYPVRYPGQSSLVWGAASLGRAGPQIKTSLGTSPSTEREGLVKFA